MAFQIKFCIEIDCKNNLLIVKDVTGVYNADTNPTGWGNGYETTDVTDVTFTVVAPGLSEPFITTLDVASGWDPESGVSVAVGTLEQIGFPEGSVWQDGPVIVTAQVVGQTVLGEPFNFKVEVSKVATCQVACCTAKLRAQQKPCGCGCQDDHVIDAHLHLLGIHWAWDCGNRSKALANLAELQAICNKKCSKCNC